MMAVALAWWPGAQTPGTRHCLRAVQATDTRSHPSQWPPASCSIVTPPSRAACIQTTPAPSPRPQTTAFPGIFDNQDPFFKIMNHKTEKIQLVECKS